MPIGAHATNAKTIQTKDLGGRRSRPLCGLARGGASPMTSEELDSRGPVIGSVTGRKPRHPVHGPLEQQPRPLQSASSEGIDGTVEAAVNSSACRIWEAGAIVSWMAGAAGACACPMWAEAAEGASQSTATTVAAPKTRAICRFKAIFLIYHRASDCDKVMPVWVNQCPFPAQSRPARMSAIGAKAHIEWLLSKFDSKYTP